MPEIPPKVNEAKYLRILDISGNEKVLELPAGRCVLVYDGSDVRFVSGADGSPFVLNSLEQQEGGDLPFIIGMTAAGQFVAFTRDETAEGELVLLNVGGVIKWLPKQGLVFPEGIGVLRQDKGGAPGFLGSETDKGIYWIRGDGSIGIIPVGAPGSVLKIPNSGATDPTFAMPDPGTVGSGGAIGLATLVGVTANNSSGSAINIKAGQILAQDVLGETMSLSNVNVNVAVDAALGAGGLDVGALANSTWYHYYVIANDTTVAGIFSLSATQPDLTNAGTFTHWAYAGVFYVESTGAVRNFYQRGRDFYFRELQWGENITITASYAAIPGTVNLSTLVPPNVQACSGAAGGGAAEGQARSYAIASDNNGMCEKLMGGQTKDFNAFGTFKYDYDRFENQLIISGVAPTLSWKVKGGATIAGKRRIIIDHFRI